METPPKWLIQGYILLFAILPWSFDLDFGSWNLRFPCEPLIGILGVMLVRWFWQNSGVLPALFVRNRFLQISLIYLLWMSVSALFSTIPLVSWKYWLVEAGYWWVFALGISAFPVLWQRAFPWFVCSMTGVAVYALARHAYFDFRTDKAMLAPQPFFPDHTMWAAALVMVVFLGNAVIGKAISERLRAGSHGKSKGLNALFPASLKVLLPFLLLFAALVFSTSRAAWVSVLVAGSVYGFLFLGRKGRLLLLLAFGVLGYFWAAKATLSLGKDVSSLERVNRWHCALRMAQEKPVAGFGPGTFQFQYLGFQKPEEMTRISLRGPLVECDPNIYGRGGGAHSEYLRVLSETGWPALLIWLVLAGVVVRMGLKLQRNLWIGLALLTFFVHSMVNDFLHDSRMAVLVWGGMALLFIQKKEV